MNLILRILLSYLIRGSDYGSAYYYCAARPGVFPFCDGLLAIDGLEYVRRQLVSFIEEHLDLGVTTVDHADIYGGYQCEAAFGEALKLAHLCERMEIVSKCGIATTAREENVIGHYITDRDHIIKSAEQSLINLATDHLDLLLIHRPDPLMDADEVADVQTSASERQSASFWRIELYACAICPVAIRLPFYPCH